MASKALSQRERRFVGAASVLALLIATLVVSSGTTANAAKTNSLLIQQLGDDFFYNHDFVSESFRLDNVDWQVSVIAYGRGSIPRTEAFLEGRYPWDGYTIASNKFGFLNENGAGWTWKPQKGRATHPAGCEAWGIKPIRYHYRDYAPRDASFYDPGSWGHFNAITTHRDQNDHLGCPSYQFYGYSELVENDLMSQAVGRTTYFKDWMRMGSARYVIDDIDKAHYWETDGMASIVKIP